MSIQSKWKLEIQSIDTHVSKKAEIFFRISGKHFNLKLYWYKFVINYFSKCFNKNGNTVEPSYILEHLVPRLLLFFSAFPIILINSFSTLRCPIKNCRYYYENLETWFNFWFSLDFVAKTAKTFQNRFPLK